MKKRLSLFIFPIITLIFEILPYGAVCNFASEQDKIHRETFSYFNLTPFGYANFFPFLTALVTCAVLAVLIVYLFTGKELMISILKVLLLAGVILSLCPLLYGINYFSLVGVLITVTLIAESVLLFTVFRRKK